MHFKYVRALPLLPSSLPRPLTLPHRFAFPFVVRRNEPAFISVFLIFKEDDSHVDPSRSRSHSYGEIKKIHIFSDAFKSSGSEKY